MVTHNYHNIYKLEKFIPILFKFKEPGGLFTMKQVREFAESDDNNTLSDEQFHEYIGKLIISGDVWEVGKDEEGQILYKRIYNSRQVCITEQKKEVIRSIDYNRFRNIISDWKIKGEKITVYKTSERLNLMDIFIDSFIIRKYLDMMVCDHILAKISRRTYKKIV